MRDLAMVSGADRIKRQGISLVVVDFHCASDKQALTPVRQWNVVIINDGDDIRTHVVSPQESEVAPLNTVPSNRFGERSVVSLLLLRGDVGSARKSVVMRRFLISDHHKSPIGKGLKPLDGFCWRIDGCSYDDFLHG